MSCPRRVVALLLALALAAPAASGDVVIDMPPPAPRPATVTTYEASHAANGRTTDLGHLALNRYALARYAPWPRICPRPIAFWYSSVSGFPIFGSGFGFPFGWHGFADGFREGFGQLNVFGPHIHRDRFVDIRHRRGRQLRIQMPGPSTGPRALEQIFPTHQTIVSGSP